MKLLALIGSGLLAATTLAVPGMADAQRHGYHHGYGRHGYGYRHYRGTNGYRYGYGYRHPYRYRHYGYGRFHGNRRGCRPGVYYSARRCY